jgi:hypothetical protein
MGPIFRIVASYEISVGSFDIFDFITFNILFLLLGLLVIFVQFVTCNIQYGMWNITLSDKYLILPVLLLSFHI